MGTFVGIGTASLDITESDRGVELSAGGTCTNIMSHLAWMRHRSIMACALGADERGRFVRDDLESRGVKCFVEWSGRQYASRVLSSPGGHGFDRRCRHGVKMPSYVPPSIEFFKSLDLPGPDAFIFDRATPAALYAAKKYSAAGALVFFEPVSRGKHGLFDECAAVSDVIKRCRAQKDVAAPARKLEIITDGANGLVLRHDGIEERLPAKTPCRMRDACGCGDCVSACIIDGLVSGDGSIASHAEAGQALAALNCSYTGPMNMLASTTAKQRLDVMRYGFVSHVPGEIKPRQGSKLRLCECLD